MQAVADHQRRKAHLLRPRGKQVLGGIEGRVREAAAGVDLDHRAARVMDLRHRLRIDLARSEHAQAALEPVDAVRLARIALARDDHLRDRRGAFGAHAAGLEDALHARQQRVEGNRGRVGHRGSLLAGLGSLGPGAAGSRGHQGGRGPYLSTST